MKKHGLLLVLALSLFCTLVAIAEGRERAAVAASVDPGPLLTVASVPAPVADDLLPPDLMPGATIRLLFQHEGQLVQGPATRVVSMRGEWLGLAGGGTKGTVGRWVRLGEFAGYDLVSPGGDGAETPRAERVPLLGEVLRCIDRVETSFVVVNVGADDGLAVGDTLEVYRASSYKGRLRVVSANDGMSICEQDLAVDGQSIEAGDSVTDRL